MLKKIIYLWLCCIGSLARLPAQPMHVPCGTIGQYAQPLKQRLLLNQNQAKGNPIQFRNTMYIPVKFHIVAQDDGTGAVHYRDVLDQLTAINNDFAPLNMQFYLHGELNQLRSTGIYENHMNNGARMDSLRDRNAINIWIVKNPSPFSEDDGLVLGFYHPQRDWIVMLKEEINARSSTLPHELGHFFSLMHTHYGWDADPWQASRHGNPAPERSPGGIPTERQDRSNCEVAGDYICDTPPDYNFGYFWIANCTYNGGAMDPAGVLVKPSESNFMGYFFSCPRSAYHFSPQQQLIIQTDYAEPLRNYLRTGYTPTHTSIVGNMQLLAPAAGATVSFYNAVTLEWNAPAGATRYLVEIDRVPNFGLQPMSMIVAGNSITIDNLEPNRQYYWRVRPFNEYVTNRGFSAFRSFRTGDVATATHDLKQLSAWSLYPNPIASDETLTLMLDMRESLEAQLMIRSATGQIIQNIGKQQLRPGTNTVQIPINGMPAGLYMLVLQSEQGRMARRLVVQPR